MWLANVAGLLCRHSDRVVEQDDALGKTVLYGHDPLGRVTSITYPGGKVLANGYDALGRLTNQVDWARRQMIYAYDPADRLIYRSYPNGVVQTNVFDTAGRLTGLSHSAPSPSPTTNTTIQAALNYAYDRNGNKTGSSESGVFNWPLPSLTDDNTGYTPAGKLINRQIQNNSATSNQLSIVAYHYDSSGNMTNAVMTTGGSTAQSWTLTYDEDNRTTSIFWQVPPLTSRIITNRYDVMGRRISETVDGVTKGYVLLLAGGMEKVLCDLDGNGNVTAWYVHGPDLCYRVDSTNGLLCYHADAMGNIIALTDGNTNLVAQYAYTPYGRSLGSTNLLSLISNPYLFVGSQGVMEESDIPNLYFMRARYYSADAGVFLSTDSVKKIGPDWMPTFYSYADSSPLGKSDPKGEFAGEITLGFALVSIIAESISIDYDILALHQNVTFADLGERYAKAAVNGATAGAIIEFGGGSGGLFTGTLGKAGAIATKGIVNFGANAVISYANGDRDLGKVAAQTFQENVLDAGFSYFGDMVPGADTLSYGSAGFNSVLQAGQGISYSSADALGQKLGSSQSVSMSSRTASIAAPVAAGATAASSTKPSGATGGGATTSSGGSTITIQSGSTLSGIARQNGTTVSALMAANPQISNPNVIYAGASLNVPGRH